MYALDDNEAKSQVLAIERDIKQIKYNEVYRDNILLDNRISQFEHELKMIDWYTSVMEEGKIPRDIMERYENDKRQFAE